MISLIGSSKGFLESREYVASLFNGTTTFMLVISVPLCPATANVAICSLFCPIIGEIFSSCCSTVRITLTINNKIIFYIRVKSVVIFILKYYSIINCKYIYEILYKHLSIYPIIGHCNFSFHFISYESN